MRGLIIYIMLALIILCGSCSKKNPFNTEGDYEGEGTIKINVHFPEEKRAKISSPEAVTVHAYVYLYSYGDQFIGKREIIIYNRTAGTLIKLQAGMSVYCKVMGFDERYNSTYQGKSPKVIIKAGQTTPVDIMMVKLGFVSIPAGNFHMGSENGNDSEKPVHTVTLDAFEMSSTEITMIQWSMIMPYINLEGIDNHPAAKVSWINAVEFCNRLSEFSGLAPCYDEKTYECDTSKNGYRLPTEAEWEYACRAGTTTAYYTGDSPEDLETAGWYGYDSTTTHNFPVGDKEPNAWGLYDMYGNVAEWCNDGYDSNYYSTSPEVNPPGPTGSFSKFVVRGGNRMSDDYSCRSSARSFARINDQKSTVGFRIVRRLNP